MKTTKLKITSSLMCVSFSPYTYTHICMCLYVCIQSSALHIINTQWTFDTRKLADEYIMWPSNPAFVNRIKDWTVHYHIQILSPWHLCVVNFRYLAFPLYSPLNCCINTFPVIFLSYLCFPSLLSHIFRTRIFQGSHVWW